MPHFNIPKKRRAETARASFERPPNGGCSWEVSRNSRVTPDADADRWGCARATPAKGEMRAGPGSDSADFFRFCFWKNTIGVTVFPCRPENFAIRDSGFV